MGLRFVFAIALATFALGATGCFLEPEEKEGEGRREGLDVVVDGVDYNVYITRELNLALPDDKGYYPGPEAKPGFSLYGIFLQACNRSDQDGGRKDEPLQAASHFRVVDTQENVYEPVKREDEDNVFAYQPKLLQPGECIPAVGGLAQQGPTAGAMLLFEFPLAAGENRPLKLEILGEHDLLEGKREKALVELDI